MVVPGSLDTIKDALQYAYNNGAFICPVAGHEKPDGHLYACQSCRVRGWLTPGWYLVPETELRARLMRRAWSYSLWRPTFAKWRMSLWFKSLARSPR
jgi:hypothetical protein